MDGEYFIMVCPACRGTENYYGRLVSASELKPGREPPKCPNHPPESPCLLVDVD